MIKVELLSWWGPGDKRVAEAAWASTYDKDKWENRTEDQRNKVLDIIVGLGHGTPEETVSIEYYIECPIYVERQLDKYRMTQQFQDFQIEYQFAPMGRDHITQNELSGRYRTIPDRFIEMPADVKDILSRANKTWIEEGRYHSVKEWDTLMKQEYEYYRKEITVLKQQVELKVITQAEYKRAREFLRGALGTGFITHMKLIVNLRAFEHILNQRLAHDAQPEIQEVARLMLKTAVDNKVAPEVIKKMIEKNKWEV